MSEDHPRLKIVIVGHVDHGKSTLIGRLFYDTHSLPDGKIEQIQKACDAEGMEFEYAFLLDALLEEQAQNITIDTTQIQFSTPKRQYVIIDAPGHKEFLKNMITGAAHADAALLLIDAKEGVQEQSRRHGHLLSLLNVRQVIVAINKMDLVDYDEATFRSLQQEASAFLEPLGVQPAHFIPLSAKEGDGIVALSSKMPWYQGPPLLEALENFQLPPSRNQAPLRLMVQDIYRFDHRRIIAGRIETGELQVGDTLVFWPDRKTSKIQSIETWGTKPPPQKAEAGQSVALTLEEQIFIERGQLGSHPDQGPIEARAFHANVFWLHDHPLQTNQPYTLKLGTQSIEARLVKIEKILDSSTLENVHQARTEIYKNEVAQLVFRARHPFAFDNIDHLHETGRFVIFEGNRIGGGGIIHHAEYASHLADPVKSENISWSQNEVSREARMTHLGHQGAVLWLTGLSGSGKSTLSVALESFLFSRGMSAFILDGDNLRHGLCSDLGFSPEDRTENIRRAAEAAKLLAESGHIVITALISPFEKDREHARQICHSAGIPFAEIYLNASLETCEKRDPKSLYQRARAGEIQGFTGIDSPYEPPSQPTLTLPTDQASREECLKKLVDLTLMLTRLETLDLVSEERIPAASI